jgi:hypothetical protein
MKHDHSSLRRAIERKIDALKAEAERLTGDLVSTERSIAHMQGAQSELQAKLARAAARAIELRRDIAHVHEQIGQEMEA